MRHFSRYLPVLILVGLIFLDRRFHTMWSGIFSLALLLWLVLYCFLLFPRRRHPKWEILRRYRYAHRGFHDKPRIPENSLPAFRRAVERGFGAELDVHLTRDKRLAVIHDASLKRTCGVQGNVEDLTVSELSLLRLEGTQERIPFLEEVLPLFVGQTPLVVEIKPTAKNWAELTARTVACLDRFPVEYCVESFDPHVVLWLRQNRPEIVRGQLAEDFEKNPYGLGLLNRFIMTNLLYNCCTRPDFIAYRLEDCHRLAPHLCCDWIGGQEVNWTVRCRTDMERAEQAGHLVIFEKFDPEEDVFHEKEQKRKTVAQENLQPGNPYGAERA